MASDFTIRNVYIICIILSGRLSRLFQDMDMDMRVWLYVGSIWFGELSCREWII